MQNRPYCFAFFASAWPCVASGLRSRFGGAGSQNRAGIRPYSGKIIYPWEPNTAGDVKIIRLRDAEMTKTLQITGIIAAVMAGVLLIIPAILGGPKDKESEEFLNSAGVIDNFNQNKGEKKAKGDSHVSPLVKQAQAFALYLNPPPKLPPPSAAPAPAAVPKPEIVSAKFELVGTSYYALHPEMSMALIDEPGKDLRWVRQSGSVGHLIIEQIKDKVVVVRDGQRTFELVAKRPEQRSLIRNTPKNVSAGETAMNIKPAQPIIEEPPPSNKKIELRNKFIKNRPNEIELMNKFIKNMPSGKASGKSKEETTAALEKFVSELQAGRVSAKEANQLSRLGKELKNVPKVSDANSPPPKELKKDTGQDPNQARSRVIRRPKRRP